MRLTLVRAGFIAVALHGCFPTQPHDLEWDVEGQTVYIWNGKECIEAVRNSHQLSQLENLAAMVKRNGKIEPFFLYAENVPPATIKSLFQEGGTIDLPNGDRLIFPRGSSSKRSAIISTGQATLENGRTITYDGGTFSGPLPEITTSK
jgi:hypothetical protein